jgi:hypothetical protein
MLTRPENSTSITLEIYDFHMLVEGKCDKLLARHSLLTPIVQPELFVPVVITFCNQCQHCGLDLVRIRDIR